MCIERTRTQQHISAKFISVFLIASVANYPRARNERLNDLRTNARNCLISRVIVARYSCKILSFIGKRHIGFEQNRNYFGTRRSGWRLRERSLISCNFLEYEYTGRFIILLRLCPLIRTVGILPLIFGYPHDKTTTSHAVHHHRRGRWCACTYTRASTGIFGKAQIYEPINYRARHTYLTRRPARETLTRR